MVGREKEDDKLTTSSILENASDQKEDKLKSDTDRSDDFDLLRVITPKLSAVLDRTKIGGGKSTFVIAETVQSLGHSIDDFNINRNSIGMELKWQKY